MIEIKTINDVVCVHGTPGGNKAGMSVYVFFNGWPIDRYWRTDFIGRAYSIL